MDPDQTAPTAHCLSMKLQKILVDDKNINFVFMHFKG